MGRKKENKHVNPPEVVERLVTENMRLAFFFAAKYNRRFYCGEFITDEANALSFAMDGLLQAAQCWDESRGIPFGSYASLRIKWRLDKGNGQLERLFLSRGAKTTFLHLDSDIVEDGLSFGEIIPDISKDSEDIPVVLDYARPVMDALATLNAYEQDILKRRFGIGCEVETLEEVGASYGLTRERIRQMEAQLLELLRSKYKKFVPALKEASK